jgi:hypothetical protein
MKRLFATTVVMLLSSAMFFVVVCAGGALKANSNSSAVVERSFIGTWIGGSTFYFPSTCPADKPLLAIATAKGIATHTGASEFDSTFCCNPNTGECVGTAKITAANGDEIHLTLTHFFSPVTGDWTQNETIIGGTGRFEGATGSGSSSGTSTPTGQFSDTWEGKNVDLISY